MILGTGQAPGKAILFGEHAVVYGRPALAVPVSQVQATVTVEPAPTGSGLVLTAVDLDEQFRLGETAPDNPLDFAARLALAHLGLGEPDWQVKIRSTIPIASGLGSGAAVAVAMLRGFAAAAKQELSTEDLSELAFQVEKLHHGTPSGIDNAVIAYGQPVYFRRGKAPAPFCIGQPFMLTIADSGLRSPTKITVGDVRRRWEAEPARFEAIFDAVGKLVESARCAIAGGTPEKLGPLMDANHSLLMDMGVSCPELDSLVSVAKASGAGGAKLSGGGRGGNLIALVTEETAACVADSLRAAGAANVIVTTLG